MCRDNKIKSKTKEAKYTYMIKKINILKTWFFEVTPENDKLYTYADQMHL